MRLLGVMCLVMYGCVEPYERRRGEFNAGPVDPVQFPPPYLGADGNRQKQGQGKFTAAIGYAGETPVKYFSFPFSASRLAPGADPLRLKEDGQPYRRVPTPLAYVFDPEETSAFPLSPRCQVPPDYTFDPVRDAFRSDEQGNIFTALPEATYNPGALPTFNYVPVVAQVPVTSLGNSCQDIKSEKTLLTRSDVSVPQGEPVNGKQVGASDGKYLAWAIIDPGAGVFLSKGVPKTGLGVQKWGWFGQFLLAYLDGGYIPTAESTVDSRNVVRMVPQVLYHPRSAIGDTTSNKAGGIGQGYDVIEFARGQQGYSPVCQVKTYDPALGAGTPTAADALPKSASTILALYGSTLQPGVPEYVFCLQPEQQEGGKP
ncbi:MAG: hypothetical protein ACT4TC_03660 [Myxococcaceae bacterium]